MANNRRKYYRRTRKIRMRDLKISPTGIISMVSALAAIVFFAISVADSYRMSGAAGFLTGSLGLIGLVLAFGAWILGLLCLKEKNVRPYAPRAGIVLGIILTLALGGLYIYGWV